MVEEMERNDMIRELEQGKNGLNSVPLSTS